MINKYDDWLWIHILSHSGGVRINERMWKRTDTTLDHDCGTESNCVSGHTLQCPVVCPQQVRESQQKKKNEDEFNKQKFRRSKINGGGSELKAPDVVHFFGREEHLFERLNLFSHNETYHSVRKPGCSIPPPRHTLFSTLETDNSKQQNTFLKLFETQTHF